VKYEVLQSRKTSNSSFVLHCFYLPKVKTFIFILAKKFLSIAIICTQRYKQQPTDSRKKSFISAAKKYLPVNDGNLGAVQATAYGGFMCTVPTFTS